MIEILSISATEAEEITEPVDVSAVKRWANIDHSDDDVLLAEMITGAREDVERETNLKLVANAVEMEVLLSSATELVTLPYGVVSDVVVNEYDLDNEPVDMVEGEDYRKSSNGLSFNYSGRYKVAYNVTATKVPRALKEAIIMLVTYRYNNRGDQDKQHGMPEDIERKLSNYRVVWL